MTDATAATDVELLTRTNAGDSTALGQLFHRYEAPVFRFLLGVLKDRNQAEDALQDTFVQAIRKSDQVQSETFRSWLFTVAYHQAMVLKRKAKRVPGSLGDEGLLGLLDRADSSRRADVAAAVALLGQLPTGQQTVIRMRIFEGLRFQDVADRLGIPLGTALARMHDGLKKLRGLWEERYA